MKRKKAEREARKIIRDYSLAIGGSILIALFIRFFLLEAYRMPSRAMQPAVEPGDTLFVSKFSYGFRMPWNDKRIEPKAPAYGDVIVLEFPEEPGRDYIKRVVGMPGDKIAMNKGSLVLNGKTVTEVKSGNDLCAKETLPPSFSYTVCFEPPVVSTDKEITVPPEHVYVTSDLRSAPFDGRRLRVGGLVPYSLIRGRAQFVWLSIQSPGSAGSGGDWFSRIRFDRLFHKIH